MVCLQQNYIILLLYSTVLTDIVIDAKSYITPNVMRDPGIFVRADNSTALGEYFSKSK